MKLAPNLDELQHKRTEIETCLELQYNNLYSKFRGELEEQFWNDRENHLIKMLIRATIPACFCYFLFMCVSLTSNYFSADEIHLAHDLGQNVIAFIACWIALLTTFYMAHKKSVNHLFTPVVSTVVCFALTINLSIQLSMLSLAVTWRGTIVMALAIVFVYLFSGLRPKYTFYSSMCASVLSFIYLKIIDANVAIWVVANTLILPNLVGLSLAILAISNERIRYMQSILIDYDKEIYAKMNAHFMALSQHDSLTHLRNRRGFEPQLRELMFQTNTSKRAFALLFIDIDYFKLYNDTYGHDKGDKALISVAETLLQNIREDDIAIRFGGEEFIIILRETSLNISQEISTRIISAIEAQKIEHKSSPISDYLTVSIGLTLYAGENIAYSDILQRADQALYTAKKSGRNQYHISDM